MWFVSPVLNNLNLSGTARRYAQLALLHYNGSSGGYIPPAEAKSRVTCFFAQPVEWSERLFAVLICLWEETSKAILDCWEGSGSQVVWGSGSRSSESARAGSSSQGCDLGALYHEVGGKSRRSPRSCRPESLATPWGVTRDPAWRPHPGWETKVWGCPMTSTCVPCASIFTHYRHTSVCVHTQRQRQREIKKKKTITDLEIP